MNQKQIVDLIKRFLIIFVVVCIPIVVVLTLCVKQLSSIWVIVIAVLATILAFALEEYIHFKILKKKQERREKYKRDKK